VKENFNRAMTEAGASVQTLWQHMTMNNNKMLDEIRVKDAEIAAKNAEIARIRKELDEFHKKYPPKKGEAKLVKKDDAVTSKPK